MLCCTNSGQSHFLLTTRDLTCCVRSTCPEMMRPAFNARLENSLTVTAPPMHCSHEPPSAHLVVLNASEIATLAPGLAILAISFIAAALSGRRLMVAWLKTTSTDPVT